MRKPRGRHRRCPYYKVQVFNPVSMTWQDERRAFDSAADATEYIRTKLSESTARIMTVEERGRHLVPK
jgi:hypothetical protein